MPKKEVCKIEIHRAEGLTEECAPVTLEIGRAPTGRFSGYGTQGDSLSLWVTAQLILGEMGQTAPTAEEGGYDKTDFTITWEDGETYKGRFDLIRGGINDGGDTLWEQVAHFLGSLAGTRRPSWMSDEQWDKAQRLCREDQRNEALKFLEEYQIGPQK